MSEAFLKEGHVSADPAILPKAPPRRRKAKKARKAVAAVEKPASGEFAGGTANKCPTACTADRCVISTVNMCKHPRKSGDSGCGPVTIANRKKFLKMIEHQKIDARE